MDKILEQLTDLNIELQYLESRLKLSKAQTNINLIDEYVKYLEDLISDVAVKIKKLEAGIQ